MVRVGWVGEMMGRKGRSEVWEVGTGGSIKWGEMVCREGF